MVERGMESWRRIIVWGAVCVAGLALLPATAWAGQAQVQQWKDLPGYQATGSLADGELNRPPDAKRTSESFEATSAGPSAALRVYGWVVPPADGDYHFMVAAGETAVLFVSGDDKPEGRKQVAMVPAGGGRLEWRRYAAQVSNPISLKAGKKVWVEAIQKSGDAGGHVEVGWVLPDGNTEGPIPGSRLETVTQKVALPTYGSVKSTITLKAQPGPATRPGDHLFPGGATVELPDQRFDMSYLLSLPSDYDKTNDQRPLFIFLHGNGHQGSDLQGILNEGPANYLNDRQGLRRWFPMIALYPQLPPDWRWDSPGAAGMVVGLIDQVCQRYPRIDRDRVYLTGLSMGGKGTWLVAMESPQTFAAIAPISAVATRPKSAEAQLASLNFVWIICGERDNQFTQGSKQMDQALRPTLGDRVKLTVVPGGEHGCWGLYYPTRPFYDELLKHRRSQK